MKRPYIAVRELLFDNLKKSKENTKFLFEHSDKFLVWIVGFSIGGIAIIISNFSQLENTFTYSYLKIILMLLCFSIISGIVYRIAFYFYFSHFKNAENFLEISFSKKNIMNIHAKDISHIESIDEIIIEIKNNFGKKVLKHFSFPEIIDENNQNQELEKLKHFYGILVEISKNDFEKAIETAKNAYNKAFGISFKKLDKIFSNSYSSKRLRIWGNITTLSFMTSCLFFIAVIIFLCFLF